MHEALERILGHIPAYLRTLSNIVPNPKRFIQGQFSQGDRQLENALVFLGISFLIGWVAKSSFGDHSLMDLATDAVFLFIGILAFGLVLCLVWRVVNGRAQIQKLLIVHFYYSGVLYIFYSCWFLITIGIIRIGNPAFYKLLMDNVHRANMKPFTEPESVAAISHSPGFLIAYVVGLLAIIAWFFVGWGAYRELNRLSKLRSALAAALFVPSAFVVGILIFMMSAAVVK